MTDEIVRYEVTSGIATVTLDSPGNRNALSAQLIAEITAHLESAVADEQVRAVLLTHTGATFCAGADLRESAAEGGPAAGTARMLGLLRRLVELPKPVVARVDGNVRAGGIGLVGACDIAIVGPATTFAFTEVRLGLAPAIITLTLRGRMTERSLARYYLTGETFDAKAAAASGLVTVAVEDVDAEVEAVCGGLRRGSPQGLAESKRLSTAGTRAGFDSDAASLQALSQRLFESDEAREGVTSFLEKRPPRWVRE
ncbi:enoyl-CoA hydratase family protein [Jatrophihabitans sp.]|uniref:enoyl-CoA hydratase family protein n=1 Tax=Jatrophihabitans sp. TaxID=1932789 RepID=UPI0030C6F681|nr:Enoyl-CoA hydratase/isomerase [Jatrophihabitans sp.]